MMNKFFSKMVIKNFKNKIKLIIRTLNKYYHLFLPHVLIDSVFILILINLNSYIIEFRTTVHGVKEHWKRLAKKEISTAALRRNIHRIEKALVMDKRRAVFAESYIVDTVDYLSLTLPQSRIYGRW